MVDELLDGFTFGPTTVNDAVVGDHFAQHFWGEKNLGFSVLYHNMKHGQNAVKFLQDLVRESANTEDVYAKHLTKLAKQAANVPTVGSCAPVFEVIKTMAEKLSSCHGDVVLKLNELIKELAKYLEEQKGKHKQVKDQLSGTADALSLVQSTTASVKRSKEKYHQLCIDTERLKRSSAPTKDIERLETKSKRAADEYRGVVEKYAKARSDFEQKMTDSAKRFQDVEEAHLKHMKSVFEAYILSHENANVLINQVHQEFRRQVGLHSVESLLQQYSVSKGTGTEKPGAIEFEECDLSAADLPTETPSVNGAASEDNNPAPQTRTNRIPIGLPFRRKKTGTRKSQKEGSSGGSNKGTDRDAESIESPDKESGVKIDDEGYTIRPETPKSTKNSWGFGSSGSDSDSDDAISRKIHVKIKPKEEALGESAGSDIDTLNAITRNLTLNSPTPLGGKRLSRRKSGSQRTPAALEIAPRTEIGTLSDVPEVQAHEAVESLGADSKSLGADSSCIECTLTSPIPDSPRKRNDSLPVPSAGAEKLLSSSLENSDTSPAPSPCKPPVPKPRQSPSEMTHNRSSLHNKLSASPNRFSTAFVPDFDARDAASIPTSDADRVKPVARPRLHVGEPIIETTNPRSSSESSFASSGCSNNLNESPERRSSFLTAKMTPTKTKYLVRNSPSNVTLRNFVQSPEATEAAATDVLQDSRTGNGSEKDRISGSWVKFDEESKGTQSDDAPSSTLYGANKAKQSPVDKTEKSISDELLDLFGNTPATSAKPSAAASSSTASANNVNAFADLFASKPDSPGTAARKSNMTSPLPPSSSNVSLNNLLVESSDKEVEMATKNQPSPRLPPPRRSSDLIDQAAKSSRPTDLSLSHSRPHPQKGSSSHSAPLASSESWSSLSSVAGTPMDSFASSRGPSPLTLMHGDPIPVAVAFTETVNAYFKGADNSKCIVRIVGEIQMSFPAGIVRAFTSNPNPPELSFKIHGASSLKDFTPNAGLLDMPRSDLSLSSFCFNMSALTTHIKKMTDANPNSPYYNVQVLSYQMASPSGYDLVPLHVSSSWTCEADSTDVRVEYKYNSKFSNATLKNVHVLVPVSGVISDVQSTPQANWIAAQNRLSWRLPAPITSSSVAGVLQSKLSLSSGPSKAATLAVQFMSEGSTLSGADFQLTGTGYRLSLVKRRFVTGKYLCDAA